MLAQLRPRREHAVVVEKVLWRQGDQRRQLPPKTGCCAIDQLERIEDQVRRPVGLPPLATRLEPVCGGPGAAGGGVAGAGVVGAAATLIVPTMLWLACRTQMYWNCPAVGKVSWKVSPFGRSMPITPLFAAPPKIGPPVGAGTNGSPGGGGPNVIV